MDNETREAVIVLVIIVAFIVGAYFAAQIWITGQAGGANTWTFWPHMIVHKSHF